MMRYQRRGFLRQNKCFISSADALKILMLQFFQTQFFRFCIVGGINTLVDIAVFSLLFYAASLPLLIANALGFGAGVLNSYLLNKKWTYRDTSPHSAKRVSAFVLVALGGLAISTLTVWVMAAWVVPLIAKLAACVTSLVWNFLMTRYVVFKKT